MTGRYSWPTVNLVPIRESHRAATSRDELRLSRDQLATILRLCIATMTIKDDFMVGVNGARLLQKVVCEWSKCVLLLFRI